MNFEELIDEIAAHLEGASDLPYFRCQTLALYYVEWISAWIAEQISPPK